MKKYLLATIILALLAFGLHILVLGKPISKWSTVYVIADTTVLHSVTIGGDYVYATGFVQEQGTGTDLLVLKEDLSGNKLWEKSYDNFYREYGSYIKYYNGKIYVFGLGQYSTGEINVFLACFDENGVQEWVRVWGQSGIDDYPAGLAVDGSGIYVAVYSLNPDTGEKEYWLLKYSLSGYIQKYINGPGDSDEAKDLYIYGDRLYLVGGSDGEAFLAIYDKDLNTFLFKKFNKLLVVSGIQYFSDVAVDKLDDKLYIYVAVANENGPSVIAILNEQMVVEYAAFLSNIDIESIDMHYHILTFTGYGKDEDTGDKQFILGRFNHFWDIFDLHVWGGSNDDVMMDLALKHQYIILAGYSSSYSTVLGGIVWAFDSSHTLEITVPDDEIQWLVFYHDFALPVGGSKGSGSTSLPETLYHISVTEELEKDSYKLVFSKWSDGVTDNPRNITLLDDTKLTAIYDTYYKIEVKSEYGQTTGTGYYKAGTTATISVTTTQIPLAGNQYAVFKGWKKDGQIVSTQPITQVVVNEPATYEAVWEIKSGTPPQEETYTVQVVSMYGTVTGSGTYSAGSQTTVSVDPTVIEHDNRTRHVFKGWMINGQIVSTDPTYTFQVTQDTTVEAIWETQYYVRVTSTIGQTSGTGWYTKGAKATASVTPTSTDEHAFKGWSIGGTIVSTENPYTFTVTEPVVVEAVWTGAPPPQPSQSGTCIVVIESEHGEVKGSGEYSKGDIVVVSVEPSVIEEDGTRKVFVKWVFENGTVASTSPSFRFRVYEDTKLTAVWATEYYVKVVSDIGEVEGSGWYRKGSTAQVKVASIEVTVGGEKYVFKQWIDENGNVVYTNPRYIFKVEDPVYLKAVWEKVSTEFRLTNILSSPIYLIALFAFVLSLAVMVLVVLKMRKKGKRE